MATKRMVLYKLVVLGDGGTGKTALTIQVGRAPSLEKIFSTGREEQKKRDHTYPKYLTHTLLTNYSSFLFITLWKHMTQHARTLIENGSPSMAKSAW